MLYLLSCDIHTHTIFSAHAYSTIEENVYWAAERGLQVLGSADHLSSMVTACPNDLRSYQFFINQDIWPRIWSGVLVLRGAEADIVSLDGSLFGEDTPCHARYCRRFVQPSAFAVRFGYAKFGLFGCERA